MFAAFNVKISGEDILEPCMYELGKPIYAGIKNQVQGSLKEYISSDENTGEILDEKKIEDTWFPSMNYDVFISHSHKDQKLAIALAGWLNEIFGISSFIDSYVWNYSDDLLKIIDDEYCVKFTHEDGSKTYSYERRNNSTAHVHIILNAALQKMIDRCEAVFFLNTPNSILLDDVIEGTSTASPWIYSEILTTGFVRHRPLLDYRNVPIQKGITNFNERDLRVKYNVNLDEFTMIDGSDLRWLWKCGRQGTGKDSLDRLYEHKSLIKE